MLLVPKQQAADSGLNMTPMIDIVFQLILFFLFNLRFKALDWRIDTNLPRDRGIEDTFKILAPLPSIKASLVRLDAEDPARARTRVRIAGAEWVLPDPGRATPAERDELFARIARHIGFLRGSGGEDLHGQIDTPAPFGAMVPHGDVVGVLDAFVEADVKAVDFVGAGWPLPRRR